MEALNEELLVAGVPLESYRRQVLQAEECRRAA